MKDIEQIPRADLLTPEEGKALLHLYSTQAADKIKEGALDVTQGIILLHRIREYRLFVFGAPDWGTFLSTWLDENGLGRSTIYNLLMVARCWTDGLGRDLEKLLEYNEGVQTFSPLFVGPTRIVREHNRATGEIKALADSWAKTAPAGDTPAAQVNALIDEIPKESTARVVAGFLKKQTSGDKDKYTFCYAVDRGQVVGLGWQFDGADGSHEEGTSIRSMNKYPHVLRKMAEWLRIPREWQE